jgi:hypothetical protein
MEVLTSNVEEHSGTEFIMIARLKVKRHGTISTYCMKVCSMKRFKKQYKGKPAEHYKRMESLNNKIGESYSTVLSRLKH